MECDLKREMKCEIECDPPSHDAPQNDHRKRRIERVKGGIEDLSDLALFTMLLGFSLCVSLSGLLLKDAWGPYNQVLGYWRVLPIEIRLEVGLISISLLCLFAFLVILTPVLKALSDELVRRLTTRYPAA
jgi:hypothetical protein